MGLDNFKRALLERDLALFEEEARRLQRMQDTEALLQVYETIRGELRERFSFDRTQYLAVLAQALLKSGELPAHRAWYLLANSWYCFQDSPEVFSHLVDIAKRDKDLREALYDLAKRREVLGNMHGLVCLGALKAYLPTRELRAAFITGRHINNLRENTTSPKWQMNTVSANEEEIQVTVTHRCWRQDWKTKKYKEETPQSFTLYRETKTGAELHHTLPWRTVECRLCADQGGVWKSGELEGSGKCPRCKKEYVPLYGVITSPAFEENQGKFRF